MRSQTRYILDVKGLTDSREDDYPRLSRVLGKKGLKRFKLGDPML